jgi:peptide/nickel transport system ATP-binding protein
VAANQDEILLEVRDLAVEYKSPQQVRAKALDGVSFQIPAGESVAVLGESGSGKSTLALAILRLLPPHANFVRGTVRFRDQDLLEMSETALESIRGAQIAMIFQQPALALNPLMRVRRQVAEVIRAHRRWSWSRCRDEATLILDQVFENQPGLYESYPHELSGGERQRISIAQALACNPHLVIADEPTASLDAVVQANLLHLFRRLQHIRALSFLLITHNAALVPGLADRVLVLREGRLIEEGNLLEMYRHPQDSYTADLLHSALPSCAS